MIVTVAFVLSFSGQKVHQTGPHSSGRIREEFQKHFCNPGNKQEKHSVSTRCFPVITCNPFYFPLGTLHAANDTSTVVCYSPHRSHANKMPHFFFKQFSLPFLIKLKVVLSSSLIE
jgi:hypothetical protein